MFCGGTDLTKEHVWPRWLNGVIGEGTRFGYRHGTATTSENFMWSASGFTQTVGDVCRRCNNGWLSALEAAAKPLLSPMIQGRVQTLDEAEQKTVAVWAAKTAAVIDRTHRYRTIPPEHARLLGQLREPPSGVLVWLAAYGVDTFVGTHKGFRLSLGRDGGHAYGATLSVGHLVLQVLGLPEEVPPTPPIPSETLDFIVQAWPPVGGAVSWPPKFAVDDEGLENLSAPPWETSKAGG